MILKYLFLKIIILLVINVQKKGNDTYHNCDKCKEGFVYIEDSTSNCYNKPDFKRKLSSDIS